MDYANIILEMLDRIKKLEQEVLVLKQDQNQKIPIRSVVIEKRRNHF